MTLAEFILWIADFVNENWHWILMFVYFIGGLLHLIVIFRRFK